MPITRQAKKKMRHDKKVTLHRKDLKSNLKKTVKTFRAKPTPPLLTKTFSVIDKAVKKRIIHANTSNRLKSRLSRLLSKSAS